MGDSTKQYYTKMPEDYSIKLAQRIGKNLKRKREESKMTIYHLFTRTGINWNTIKHWEHGTNVPHLDYLLWICHVMGWKMSELLGGKQNDGSD